MGQPADHCCSWHVPRPNATPIAVGPSVQQPCAPSTDSARRTISSNPLLVTLDAYLFQSLSNYDPTATLYGTFSTVPYSEGLQRVMPATCRTR